MNGCLRSCERCPSNGKTRHQSRTIADTWNFEISLILSLFVTPTNLKTFFIFFIYFLLFHHKFISIIFSSLHRRKITSRAKWILKPIRDIFNLSYDTRGWLALWGQCFFGKTDKKYFQRIFFFLFSPWKWNFILQFLPRNWNFYHFCFLYMQRCSIDCTSYDNFED